MGQRGHYHIGVTASLVSLTFKAKSGIIQALGMHCIDKISTLKTASRR